MHGRGYESVGGVVKVGSGTIRAVGKGGLRCERQAASGTAWPGAYGEASPRYTNLPLEA